MNVLIVGAGNAGVFLAEKFREKHQVTVVECRPDRAGYVAAHIPGINVVRGDGCEPAVLDEAGIAQTDLVAALTGDDEDNLVVSFLAKRTHSVPMVFARTNHPKNDWMFTKMWGVDVGVSTASVIYSIVEEEASLGDFVKMMRLSASNMEIDELVLAETSPAVGKRIMELMLPACAHVMAIVRQGNVVVPQGMTVLEAGDEVLVLSTCGEEDTLKRIFVG